MRRTSRLFAYAALALAVTPAGVTAQVSSILDTPAGRQATALFALLEAGGDEDSVRVFVEERFTPDLPARLQALADSLAAVDRFSGVILLAQGDTPVLQRAWGMADRDRRIPNTVDTRFNLGSINKIFTAAAIHHLAAEGRLSLADTLGAHLPEFPDPSARSQVTIRHLLEHRSGIVGNIFRAPEGGTRDDLRTTADFLNLFAGEPLRFAPGSRSEYSNAGYVVLGAIIERVSGQTYYEYVHDHIYRPLGMSATAHYHRASLPDGAAIGYTRGGSGDGPVGSNRDLLPGRGSSAGGGYSTAGDLLRFALAAERGEVPGVRGGLGISGGAPGLNATLETGLPGGYHLVVLANMDPPVAEQIGGQVRQWLGAR